MAFLLLFCVAKKEAKAVIPKVMRECGSGEDYSMLILVESTICPQEYEEFRRRLDDDEPFESPFINASEEQCQRWAIENWDRVNSIERDIAIADERTARDGTLLMSVWNQDNVDFEDWGPLPPKAEAWYDFRIHHSAVFTFFSQVHFGPPDAILRIYYQQPEKYTDEAGFLILSKSIEQYRQGNTRMINLFRVLDSSAYLYSDQFYSPELVPHQFLVADFRDILTLFIQTIHVSYVRETKIFRAGAPHIPCLIDEAEHRLCTTARCACKYLF